MSRSEAADAARASDLAAGLAGRLRGPVLVPTDPGYRTHLLLGEGAEPHRPAAIAVPADGADVARVVQHARAGGLRVVVHATGHGVGDPAGPNTVLIDLRSMTAVSVDERRRTATVGGGARWAPVLATASPLGLAPALPTSADVGVVGSTLGGGVGWLARRFGLARDRVRSATVITADGEEVAVSEREHPELLWWLRGAGAADLGIVTSMTFGLVAPGELHGGELRYPADMAAEVLARYSTWTADLSPSMTTSLSIEPAVPGAVGPRARPVVVLRGCHAGPAEEAAELVASWCTWAAPVAQRWGPIGIDGLAGLDAARAPGAIPPVTTEWLRTLSDDAISALCTAVLPSGDGAALRRVELRHVAGAFDAPTGGGGVPAFGTPADLLLRAEGAVAEVGGDGHDLLDDLRRALAQAGAVTGGTYRNFTRGRERGDRSPSALAPSTAARLEALVDDLDPARVLAGARPGPAAAAAAPAAPASRPAVGGC